MVVRGRATTRQPPSRRRRVPLAGWSCRVGSVTDLADRGCALLLDLFLIGLVVTLEPIPLTAMILLLATEGGLLKGLGYVLGWMLTLVVIVAVTVLVTGGKPLIPKSNPSTAALAVKLGIGVVLVFIAYRRWGSWGRPNRRGSRSGCGASTASTR